MITDYKRLQRLTTFKERGKKIKLSLYVKIFALLLLVLFIPLVSFFQDPIMKAGVSIIRQLQKVTFFSRVQTVLYWATQTCSLWMITAWSAVLYHFLDPRAGVKVIGVSCFAFYFSSLLNMLYSEPRPYWFDGSISGLLCKNGYGLPSTELFLAIVFYFYLLIQLLRKSNSSWLTGLLYTLLVLYLTFTALGEIALGEHFPHQVVITACFAFVFLIFCLAMDSNLTRWAYKAGFNYLKNRKYSVYMTILTVLLMLLAVVVSQVSSRGYLPSVWLQNSAVSR